MSKITNLMFTLLFVQLYVTGQESKSTAWQKDTAQIHRLLAKVKELMDDSSADVTLCMQGLQRAKQINYKQGEAQALKTLGICYFVRGGYVEAIDYWQQALQLFSGLKDTSGISNILNNISAVYHAQGDLPNGLAYATKAYALAQRSGDKLRILSALNNIAAIYVENTATINQALEYLLQALIISEELDDRQSISLVSANIGKLYFIKKDYAKATDHYKSVIKKHGSSTTGSFAYNGLGQVALEIGNYPAALKHFRTALAIAENTGSHLDKMKTLMELGKLHKRQRQYITALDYYTQALPMSKELSALLEQKEIAKALVEVYVALDDYKSALRHQQLYTQINDSLANDESSKKTASLQFSFDLQRKEEKIALLTKDKQLRDAEIKKQEVIRNMLFAGLAILLPTAFFLWHLNNQRKKMNKELEYQKGKAEAALQELETTQAQLVQREKIASLGELTAGIAHEIQNPLNFVNNFSEVNRELLEEMAEELEKEKVGEVKTLAAIIKDNEEKISYHGRRADSIVKSMLLHARASTGIKELTDINGLAEEYLRLSFQGMRAKDKTFHASIETSFDEAVGRIKVVPPDIGRVLLNLFNNAFYAVQQKKQSANGTYEPKVGVSTKKLAGFIAIAVRDNGPGIPQEISEKIFQPFFTTKPTGEGTGLGLSLSYDIITKGHGGELKVSIKEGEGTEFVIRLPVI